MFGYVRAVPAEYLLFNIDGGFCRWLKLRWSVWQTDIPPSVNGLDIVN